MTEHTAVADALHLHVYEEGDRVAERRMLLVTAITVAMTVVEIFTGWWSHSMALLADGWHLSSHALALGLSAAAYVCARRLAQDQRFAFGTWKIEVLGGYTSALLLAAVAVYMLVEVGSRLLHPAAIAFGEALPVAAVGLGVNLLCTLLLGSAVRAGHSHAHQGHEDHPRDDLNLRSAYVHVAADCGTSLLAIAALVAGKYFGLHWLDTAVGLVGAVIVALWAVALLRDTSRVLLDAEMDRPLASQIRQALEASGVRARVEDLHLWRVSRSKYACLLRVASEPGATVEHFRELLASHAELGHLTIEVRHDHGLAEAA